MEKFKSPIKTVFYGLCLGISLLPPGFSVATMAMILGIYESLISLLNDLFSKNMAKTLRIIACLGTGAVLAIVIFSWLISAAIVNFPYQTRFFFLGLIIATIPLIARQANVKTNFVTKHYGLMVISTIFATAFIFVNSFSLVNLAGDMTVAKLLYLLLAGALVAASMVLPGLSGALMLMLIGAYQFLLDSISSFNVLVLAIVAVGGVLGLVICSRFIKHLLEHNESILYAISIGLVFGSIPVLLYQGIPAAVFDIVTALLLGVLGYTVVAGLNKFSKGGCSIMENHVFEKKKKTTLKGEIISWTMTIAGTLLAVFLINTFIFHTVEVQGRSMYPTLSNGDRVIVWQLLYTPSFQDIVVLEHTNGDLHVKRVIGVAGDQVDYINGQLWINEVLIDEPYILNEVSQSGFLFTNLCQINMNVTDCDAIPPGYFLVLGDNRNNSGDSREYGLVHESQIMGRATLRFLPFNEFGMVE